MPRWPERRRRAHADRAARDAPVPVRVASGLVGALPLEAGSVDAAVASLVLCTVPDRAEALAETRRVPRPAPAASCAATSTSTPPPAPARRPWRGHHPRCALQVNPPPQLPTWPPL